MIDEWKAVDVIFLNFSKAFTSTSHSIILGELSNSQIKQDHDLHMTYILYQSSHYILVLEYHHLWEHKKKLLRAAAAEQDKQYEGHLWKNKECLMALTG